MARNFLDTPLNQNSINFKGISDPFERRVAKLTSKQNNNLTKVVDSGADSATIQTARRELEIAENSARSKLANEDVDKVRKATNFHRIVINVESEKRDKANATIRKLSDDNRDDANVRTQLTFARRTAERTSGIIQESQNRLTDLDSRLSNSLARQRQFSSKKGTFSP